MINGGHEVGMLAKQDEPNTVWMRERWLALMGD